MILFLFVAIIVSVVPTMLFQICENWERFTKYPSASFRHSAICASFFFFSNIDYRVMKQGGFLSVDQRCKGNRCPSIEPKSLVDCIQLPHDMVKLNFSPCIIEGMFTCA